MTRVAKVLRDVGFGWMMLVGALGGLFVAGESFDDPGGPAAVAMVASWLVPLVALAVLALRRTETAEPVFIVTTLGVAVLTIGDSALGIVPRDSWGPVAAVVVFVCGVALAFLGLHRPTLAGGLLLILAAAQVAAGLAERLGDGRHGNVFGGSSGIVILPLVIGGVLFVLAGRHPGAAPRRTRHQAAHH